MAGAHCDLGIFEVAQDNVVTRCEWDGGEGDIQAHRGVINKGNLCWSDVQESGSFLFRCGRSPAKRLVVGLVSHVRRTVTE